MKTDKRMRKLPFRMAAAVIFLLAGLTLTACGKTASPDSIAISYNGETADSVAITYGTQDSFELTAVCDPESFNDQVTWSSDDAGVVKVEETDGNQCTLTILKTGSVKITAACGETSKVVKVKIEKNQDDLTAREIALTINDTNYSAEKVNIVFVQLYHDFVNTYGAYCSYYGLDTSAGPFGLADTECDYSEDGTWRGYFLEEAEDTLKEYQARRDYADANGITLDDEELQEIADEIAEVEKNAEENGYSDADAYIADNFGDGATLALYEDYLKTYKLALKAYDSYEATLSYTDQEISDHYIEMGYEDDGENDYPTVSMRHILIMAEEDENGEYTDEAIQAAHDKAEEIYEEWKSGAADEDSFAELANEYSEDSGSNTTGGLYENIYKDEMVDGINTWLFGDRTYGDTAVIDNNGSYVGSHVVFFCGQGENYSTYLSESDLKGTAMDEWSNTLLADYTVTEGAAIDSVANE